MTESVVLDSSALLCLLNAEPGAARVVEALEGAIISAVNLAEAVGKLRERGLSDDEAREAIDSLPLEIHPFTRDQGYAAGALRPATRALGLSLGDRACLALAQEMKVPALTADREWRKLDMGVAVRFVR